MVGDLTFHPTLADALARSGCRCLSVPNLSELEALGGIGLVLLSGEFEGASGLDRARRLHAGPLGAWIPVVLVCSSTALPEGVSDYDEGPIDVIAADAAVAPTALRLRTLARLATREDAQADETQLLSLAVRQAPEGMALLGSDGCLRFANPAFLELIQRSSIDPAAGSIDCLHAVGTPGRPLADLAPEDGRPWQGDLRISDGAGSGVEISATVRRLSVRGHSEAILVVARDVTHIRMLERRLADSQRMEAVGQLAGGVAHDFNNILSVITTLSDLLIRLRAEDDPDREDLEEIFRSARRGADITRQLSAFSHTGSGQTEEVDLNERIRGNQKMFRRFVPSGVTLRFTLGESVPPVLADPIHLDQVILNLAVNAKDAMPDGGTLDISTGQRILDTPLEVIGSQLPEGTYAVLEVRDTGEGMDEATRRRIFDPFFTTRGWGRKSGLGLSVVYGSVRAGGGGIEVDTCPGEGTTFRLYLPAHGVRAGSTTNDTSLPVGEESILIVEDHELLRKGLRRFFAGLGYGVTDAADGAEALALVREGGVRPHLIVSDVVMPSLNGSELEARIRAFGLDVPVLYFSGYTDHPEVDRLRRAGVRVFPKPIDMHQLAREVRAILDRTLDQVP